MAFDYKNRLYRITNSRMIHMKEQNCIEAEKLKPVFDLIDEKVTFHAEREKVKRNIMDVEDRKCHV